MTLFKNGSDRINTIPTTPAGALGICMPTHASSYHHLEDAGAFPASMTKFHDTKPVQNGSQSRSDNILKKEWLEIPTGLARASSP